VPILTPLSPKVPLLRILEQDEGAKALFIYPTKVGLDLPMICTRSQRSFKALAQDQKAALEQLLACCPGLEHISVRCPTAYPFCFTSQI
jgi:DEAD/DEAH box helicase domain-containing protein